MRSTLAFLLVVGTAGLSDVYAQSMDELRQEFERKLRDLHAEFEAKLRETVEREVGKARRENQQEVKSTVKQALEAQPPQTLLNPAPMPPAAGDPAGGLLFLSIEPSGVDLRGLQADYAARNTPGSLTPSPFGRFRTVDVDREFAYRPTLGYYLPDGRGILSVNYYRLDAAGSDSFQAPGAVVMTLEPPGATLADLGISAIADSARATNKVNLNQFDLQYQYPIQLTKIFTLTPEFGVRGLWFKNTVKASYFTDADGFILSLEQKSDSWGVGPKVGLSGAWELFKNFNILAKGSGGYLLGNNTASQDFCRGAFFLSPGCAPPHNFYASDSRGFPFVEGEFSLNYAFGANSALRGLSASLGYRLGVFFDLIAQHKEVGSDVSTQTILQRHDLTYDSIFFRLQYMW